MEELKFMPKRVWVDSRVKGLYPGGAYSESATIDEIQNVLNDNDVEVCFNGVFYDDIHKIPFERLFKSIDEYGVPTGEYIEVDPTITLVPKGTTIEKSYCGSRFVFPNNNNK